MEKRYNEFQVPRTDELDLTDKKLTKRGFVVISEVDADRNNAATHATGLYYKLMSKEDNALIDKKIKAQGKGEKKEDSGADSNKGSEETPTAKAAREKKERRDKAKTEADSLEIDYTDNIPIDKLEKLIDEKKGNE